jgi:hypothetical protein
MKKLTIKESETKECKGEDDASALGLAMDKVTGESLAIDDLAHQWISLKEQEKDINQKRLEIEKRIVETQEAREEGAVCQKTRYYKITTTYKLTKKIDPEIWNAIKNTIPHRYHPTKNKVELDLNAYKDLMSNNREYFLAVAKCVEAKPAKPHIKVEVIK